MITVITPERLTLTGPLAPLAPLAPLLLVSPSRRRPALRRAEPLARPRRAPAFAANEPPGGAP